jgi:hypothetical protein
MEHEPIHLAWYPVADVALAHSSALRNRVFSRMGLV